MSYNAVVSTIKSVLHTHSSNRADCDRLARTIADYVVTEYEAIMAAYSDASDSYEAVEMMTRDYLNTLH